MQSLCQAFQLSILPHDRKLTYERDRPAFLEFDGTYPIPCSFESDKETTRLVIRRPLLHKTWIFAVPRRRHWKTGKHWQYRPSAIRQFNGWIELFAGSHLMTGKLGIRIWKLCWLRLAFSVPWCREEAYYISHHRIVACSTDLYGSLFQDHNRLFRLYSNNIRSSSTIVDSNTLCRHRSSGAIVHAESCWPSNCPKVSGRSAGRGYCKVVSHWWCSQNVSKVWEWPSRAHFNTRKAWSTAR